MVKYKLLPQCAWSSITGEGEWGGGGGRSVHTIHHHYPYKNNPLCPLIFTLMAVYIVLVFISFIQYICLAFHHRQFIQKVETKLVNEMKKVRE